MTSKHHTTLSTALTPTLLHAYHDLFFACTTTQAPSTGAALLAFFTNDIPLETHDLVYTSALKPLSQIPLSEFPPLLPYLGSPDAADFPQRALGLCLLLDQAPREILSGLNAHWKHDFFDVLAVRLCRELAGLPEHLRIDRVGRWQALGYSFEAAWLRFLMLCGPYIHSEDLQTQRHGQRLVEEQGRKVAEAHYGVTDPSRDLEAADAEDLQLFSRLCRTVGDGAEDVSLAEAIWRFCRIMRAHEPIVRVYGRYPNRNWEVGREDAEGEGKFLESTGQRVDEGMREVRRAVREDREAGRLRPLDQERPES